MAAGVGVARVERARSLASIIGVDELTEIDALMADFTNKFVANG